MKKENEIFSIQKWQVKNEAGKLVEKVHYYNNQDRLSLMVKEKGFTLDLINVFVSPKST